MEKKIVLQANHIDKFFETPTLFQALKDVNFTAHQGEFIALTGKSGSGKTTLLYILSTLDNQYKGELFINNISTHDKDSNQLARLRNEHLGFVFQFHYLLPDFTCLKNVILPAQRLGKRSAEEIEQYAIELFKQMDILQILNKRAALISGGQQQRVAIARALINKPIIVMGDEPTGNLDSVNSSMVLSILTNLAKENQQTILIATHDNEISSKADRQIHMKDGVIVSVI